MRTRNVVITDHQAEMIDTLVSSGRYQNASEVLREGLRMVEERVDEHKAKLDTLRQAVQLGANAMDAGHYREFESFDALDRHLRALTDDALDEDAGE